MKRTVVAAFLLLASVAAAPAQAQYRFVHLGTLAPYFSQPNAINNRNQVVGVSTVLPAGEAFVHGFLWENGRLIDLGTLPGGFISDARDINERGQIVGLAFDEVFRSHAVIWENRQIRDLGGLPGAESCAALAINNGGEIVGSCHIGGANVPVLWRRGDIVALPSPFGWSSDALEISDDGVIVIVAYDPPSGTQYSFTLERGALTFLPPAPGLSGSVALRMHPAGGIVGFSYTGGQTFTQQATLWQRGVAVPLDAAPSGAADLNARAIVGWSGDQGVVWVDGMRHVLPIPPGRVSGVPTVINDRGIIGGVAALPSGESYAVLWIPDASSAQSVP